MLPARHSATKEMQKQRRELIGFYCAHALSSSFCVKRSVLFKQIVLFNILQRPGSPGGPGGPGGPWGSGPGGPGRPGGPGAPP